MSAPLVPVRFQHDQVFPNPVWGSASKPYEKKAVQELVTKIQKLRCIEDIKQNTGQIDTTEKQGKRGGLLDVQEQEEGGA